MGSQSIHEPLVLAMVVCDWVHRDPATNKHTILGTFSSLAAPHYPATHKRLGIYVALTDVLGLTPITLKLVDVNETRPEQELASGKIRCPDPRLVAEMGFNVPGVLFPAPGEYRLQLFAGQTLLLERRILAMQIEVGEDQADQQESEE
jgi:hypothetical protein